MIDESLPRPAGRGAALVDLAREDLELYGAEELQERIEALQTEIRRSQAALDHKEQRRNAADALFSFKSS